MSRRAPTYTGDTASEVAFPLGGIGTGTISLTGRGSLAQWQIFNRPDLESFNPNSYFAIRIGTLEGTCACLLEGPFPPPYTRHDRSVGGSRHNGHGLGMSGQFGLPRMDAVRFTNAYPFALLDYSHRSISCPVRLEAYNPLIPRNEDDSSLPVALFDFTIENPGTQPVTVDLLCTIASPLQSTPRHLLVNEWIEETDLRGIRFSNPDVAHDDENRATLMVWTAHSDVSYQLYWSMAQAKFMKNLYHHWTTFATRGRFDSGIPETPEERIPIASLVLHHRIEPGDRWQAPLRFCWSAQVHKEYRRTVDDAGFTEKKSAERVVWTPYYAVRFPDARDAALYVHRHQKRLYHQTQLFRSALEESSLTDACLDAVTSTLTALRSPTTLRLEDGTLYGFEGSNERNGSCPGSCTHVWNYAQAPLFLFPRLALTMIESHFRYSMSPSGSGGMAHRLLPPFTPLDSVPLPAIDGQLGLIIKLYAYIRLTGDQAALERLWPAVSAALSYTMNWWDRDGSGLAGGIAHCTYDINLIGPNPLSQSYYIGALAAGCDLAQRRGDHKMEDRLRRAHKRACARWDNDLFNGEYFVQLPDSESEYVTERGVYEPPLNDPSTYQFGDGCLSDQMTGITQALVAGLRPPVNRDNACRALQAIRKYNFRHDFSDHICADRVFALGHESALVVCTWPHGNKPAISLAYSDEAGWTGVEYSVATLLYHYGMPAEAEALVHGVRERFDGRKRNPLDEYECGSYYARAMAAWGLLITQSGFQADAQHGHIGFSFPQSSTCWFWTYGNGWGMVRATENVITFSVLCGSVQLQTMHIEGRNLDGAWCESFRIHSQGNEIRFIEPIVLNEGQSVRLVLRGSETVGGTE